MTNPAYKTALESLESYPALMSLQHVSEATGFSGATIRRRVAGGELRACRSRAGRGGRYRFMKADVAAFLASMVV